MLEIFSGFDSLVNSMITPPRQDYAIDALGKTERLINDQIIRRKDSKLRNRRGYLLECSHFAPAEMKTKLPCVIYLHGSGCSRLEALPYVEGICRNEMTLFCFDFSGSGQSQGPISSIGWYEQEDLESVVHHLYNSGKVSRIALWGRSMGAITSLLYARRDYRISCIIADSSFASFKQLVQEMAKKIVSLPSFMAFAAFSALRSAIHKKAGFDIELLEPINHVEKMSVPALFATGDSDDFILPTHSKQLHELYKGTKQLIIFEGGHNSQRPTAFVSKALDFLKQHTAGVNDPLPENLQKDGLPLRTEPLKVFKKISGIKHEKTEEKQSLKPPIKSQGLTNPKKPNLALLKASPSQIKAPQKEAEKSVIEAARPRFQFSWLEHSSSSPSLLTPQKENKATNEEEKCSTHQLVKTEVSFENPQKDSIAIENSPMQPNQTIEVNMAAKRKESTEPTARRRLQPSNIVSKSNLKQNPNLPKGNLPNPSGSPSDPKRKHLPIFQNVEKKPVQTLVLKIDLTTVLTQQATKEVPAEPAKQKREEIESENNGNQGPEAEKKFEPINSATERESSTLDNFRTRSYSSSLLIKTPYSPSPSTYTSYSPSLQKTTFSSALEESPQKITPSTTSSYKPISGLKYNYTPTPSQYVTKSYEKKIFTANESSYTKAVYLTKSSTADSSDSPQNSTRNLARTTREPNSTDSNASSISPRKNEPSPSQFHHYYGQKTNTNYQLYQDQQDNGENVIKPYKLSEYSQYLLQAKKSQNKSVDVVLSHEIFKLKEISGLQKSPEVIE